MDIHKLFHDSCEAARHWHFPLFSVLFGYIRIMSEQNSHDQVNDLEDAVGDNILPKEILISLSSRRGL